MTTVKISRKFPFARTGRAFDLHPDAQQVCPELDLPFPNDWLVEFEGPVHHGHSYSTEQDAIAGIECALFSRGNERLVEHQMTKAIKAQNFKLLTRLAEGRGRAEGYREAAEEMEHFLFRRPQRR